MNLSPMSVKTGVAKKKNPLDTYQKSVMGASQGRLSKAAEADLKGAEKGLIAQYAQMRRGLGARQDVTRQALNEDIDRRTSIMGQSGASDKIRRKAMIEAERGFAAEEAGIGAEEAAARAGLKSQAAQLRTQESQFGRTMALQKDMFNREFKENVRTNFVNAAIAMRAGGLKDPRKWEQLFQTMKGIGYEQTTPEFEDIIRTRANEEARRKPGTKPYGSN